MENLSSSSSSVVLPESESDEGVQNEQARAHGDKKKVAFGQAPPETKTPPPGKEMNKTQPMEFEHVEASYEDTDDEPDRLPSEKKDAPKQSEGGSGSQPKKKSTCCLLI